MDAPSKIWSKYQAAVSYTLKVDNSAVATLILLILLTVVAAIILGSYDSIKTHNYPPKTSNKLQNFVNYYLIPPAAAIASAATLLIGTLVWIFIITNLVKFVIWAGNIAIASINNWWFFPLAIFLSFILYQMRLYVRAIYGFIEVIVGISALYASSVLYKDPQQFRFLLGAAGGIYIIVRGLDNIDQGLLRFITYVGRRLAARIWTIWNGPLKLRRRATYRSIARKGMRMRRQVLR